MNNANCQRCNSNRLCSISVKTYSGFSATIGADRYNGFVPEDLGLGEDPNYVNEQYCMDCGQMQGTFPLPKASMEDTATDDDVRNFYLTYFMNEEPLSNISSTVWRLYEGIANGISPKFGQFICSFAYANSNAPPGTKMPTVDEFVRMHGSRNPVIDV